MAQSISQEAYIATGLPGATTQTRHAGGTTNGAPTSGTFAVGDFIIDLSGTIWVCTTAGTPGTWTTTISSHLSLRTASATVGRNETTIFSGSTASQTLTAPSNPIDGSTWTVINKASVSVTLSFTPSMVPLGSGTGVTTYTVSAGGAYSFINYNGSQWYMVATNGADHLVDVVQTANGGTGITGFTAANNAIYSTSSSALTAGTLPVLAGGTGVTTSTGSGSNVLSATASLTNTSISTSATGTVPLTINGIAAQTADLFDVKNSAGTLLLGVGSSGIVTLGSQRLTGLANATATSDAVNYGQLLAKSLTPTTQTTAYTASTGDFVVMTGSGNLTVTLPTAPANGSVVGVINAQTTGTITIAPGAGDTLFSSTTLGASTTTTQTQSMLLYYNSSNTTWYPVVNDANKAYLNRTNTFVSTNTFNTVNISGATVMSGAAAGSATSSLSVQQSNLTATVTAASGTGTSVTYTANNTFSVGQFVTVTGVTPTGYNLTNVSVTAANATSFSVAGTATSTYVSGGTATAYPSNVAGLVVKNAIGTTVFQTGNSSTNTTTFSEAVTMSSYLNVLGAQLGGTVNALGYTSGYPAFSAQTRATATIFGDSYAVVPNGISYKTFRVDGWGRLASMGDNRPVTVIPINPANLTGAVGSGTAITCTTLNHNFSVGQWVALSGITSATALNGTWQVASIAGSTVFTLTSTATGTGTSGATSVAVSAVSAGSPTTGYVTYTTSTAHGLWVGATVTVSGITGTTGYNVTSGVVIAIPSTTTFVLYNVTTGGSPVFTSAIVSWNTAIATAVNSASAITNPSDTFQVQDIYQNPKFGISNTSTAVGSPVWAINAYNNPIINSNGVTLSINSVTASAYTPVLNDGGSLITLSAASATSVTVPTNASVPWPIGTQLNIVGLAASANVVTISAVASATTTIVSTGATANAPKLRTQYSSASVIKIATDQWLVVGDIA